MPTQLLKTLDLETFPFPDASEDQKRRIADAASELNQLREGWLYPDAVSEKDLERRTLTNLYNERPSWLALAHEKLDDAVLDAYGWQADVSDGEVLGRLLALNLERTATKA